MDAQVTAVTLVCAIPIRAVVGWLAQNLQNLCQKLAETAGTFLKSDSGPVDAHGCEIRVKELVCDLARSFEEWCFDSFELKNMEAMPQQVQHRGQNYRRLKTRTCHRKVLTRFGNINLSRATYRNGSCGRTTITPLDGILGIEAGATPGAQDHVGRQVAAAGSLQSRCIDVIAERTGARISPEKLRNLSDHLAQVMQPQREACQVRQLEK